MAYLYASRSLDSATAVWNWCTRHAREVRIPRNGGKRWTGPNWKRWVVSRRSPFWAITSSSSSESCLQITRLPSGKFWNPETNSDSARSRTARCTQTWRWTAAFMHRRHASAQSCIWKHRRIGKELHLCKWKKTSLIKSANCGVLSTCFADSEFCMGSRSSTALLQWSHQQNQRWTDSSSSIIGYQWSCTRLRSCRFRKNSSCNWVGAWSRKIRSEYFFDLL